MWSTPWVYFIIPETCGKRWRMLTIWCLQTVNYFIALYNDTGSQSSRWKWIKKTYNRLPRVSKVTLHPIVIAPDEIKAVTRIPADVESWFVRKVVD
jgi:hypothetical protein